VVVNPCGYTEPFRVAEKLATLVAALVATTGAPMGLNVVKVRSSPNVMVPPVLATSRKWYVVFELKPVIFALTYCVVCAE
jgi:hypothetical protein